MSERSSRSIAAVVADVVAIHGERVAVVSDGHRVSYRELGEQSDRFAAGLVAVGVEPGDRVAVWAPNSPQWIVAVLGVFAAGGVLVPVNTRFKGNEAADVLRRSGSRVLVTVTDFLDANPLDLLIGADLPDLATTVVLAGPVPAGALSYEELLGRGGEDHQAEVRRRIETLTGDDPSDILFTSGTTGRPKGVVQTQARTLLVASDWGAMTGLRAGDRYLMVNPYFHMFGLKAGILAAVLAGATMYPAPTFDVDRVLRTVAAEAITVLPGAPTIYQSILDHPDRGAHDLSSLRVAVTGAADIPVALIRRIFDELPFEVVVTGYGLTEGGTAAATRPGDDPETIATTVGRARPGFEIRIVDGERRDLPPGEAGEVLIRGGSVMSHYLDDPAATAEALDAEGWLGTGDLGVVDDAGNLRIVGRSKDMFIVGGFNAYPAEIENLLLDHPDLVEAAVIGIPDERLGEVGMAFVVPAAGTSPDGAEVVAWAREHMANYKAPRRVEVVTSLPRNATGKVVKDELRDRFDAGR